MQTMSRSIPSRADIPVESTWDLNAIFPTLADWENAFANVDSDFGRLAGFTGQVASGEASRIASVLADVEAVRVRVSQVAVHARLAWAVDTSDSANAERSDRASGLIARFAAATAWLEPELLALGAERLSACASSPQLSAFAHPLERLARRAPHVLSPDVEQVMARASEAFGAGKIHSALTDTDLKFDPAVASDGTEREIGQGTIGKLLTDPDRAVRQSAWENYADRHLALRSGLAATLATGVRQNVFVARTRGYASPLHASLESNFIPVDVFERLIDAFQRHLPVWHRYWELRRRRLGLEKLAPWDAKAPLGHTAGPEIPYAQAVEWIADGIAPLGGEYVDALRKGCLEQRWIDIYPNRGKRMGAFSSGTYGTHPYILMSYNDDIFSLSTLAHELGHSLHSWYSRRHQPPQTAGYGLFVAEVASNFNQALVRSHLSERFAGDREFEIALIEEAMSNYHRYFFVMPTLARFEREIHDRVWAGGGLTAPWLIERMAQLFGEAFGTDVDLGGPNWERLGSTWMQFSTHMYANFYVYQYATGIAGAHALAKRVATGDPAARDAYLGFLKAGGSKYPLDALKDAGVDMLSAQPVEDAFAVMAGYVDRLAELLDA